MPENIDTGRNTKPAAKRKSAESRSAPRVSVPRVSTGHSSIRNAASETSSIPLASKTISAVSEPTAPSTIGFHRGGIRNAMTAPAAHRMKNAANSWAVMLISAPQSALAREIPASTVAFSRRRQARREGSPKVAAGIPERPRRPGGSRRRRPKLQSSDRKHRRKWRRPRSPRHALGPRVEPGRAADHGKEPQDDVKHRRGLDAGQQRAARSGRLTMRIG